MKIEQKLLQNDQWTNIRTDDDFRPEECQLVLVFSDKSHMNPAMIQNVRQFYPQAEIVSVSTAGEIVNDCYYENQLTLTALWLEKTTVKCIQCNYYNIPDSFEMGKNLMGRMETEGLSNLMLFSDGSLLSGSELVAGINSQNPDNILLTGGMAGDGERFESTLVGLNEHIAAGSIVLVGFYGSALKVGHGSLGGWTEFGPERTITRSKKNVLYSLDDKSALQLYKEYLGKYADDLPTSSFMFPLSIYLTNKAEKNVRTILSINEEEQTMIFAGDMPEGAKVRLMKANSEKLINAAGKAAQYAINLMEVKPQLAILISCVGRRIVLADRVEEELENAKEILGDECAITGFYSYGEISPLIPDATCSLQNQSMTITTLTEQ